MRFALCVRPQEINVSGSSDSQLFPLCSALFQEAAKGRFGSGVWHDHWMSTSLQVVELLAVVRAMALFACEGWTMVLQGIDGDSLRRPGFLRWSYWCAAGSPVWVDLAWVPDFIVW